MTFRNILIPGCTYSVLLFNDLFILQLTILALVFNFYSLKSQLSVFILSTTYLVLIVAYGWFLEFDVFINFLAVIDLGLFFILLAFIMNFNNSYNYTYSVRVGEFNKVWLLLLVVAFMLALTLPVNSYLTPSLEYLCPSTLLLNWGELASAPYISDLQLWSDSYYTFNLFEFILANVILYVAIVVIYLLIQKNQLTGKLHLSKLPESPSTHLDTFMKYQDTQKQVNRVAIVRVWSRSKNNLK